MTAACIGLALTTTIAVGAAGEAPRVTGDEPVVGGPCEGCEAALQGIPADIPTSARIARPDEPGEPMRITGVVRHSDGTPAPGSVIYAYHTNAGGIYPKGDAFRGQAAFRHGTLRAWARSDDEGRYRFDTIRPGGYPNSSISEHVHMHVIEPGRCTYYIDSIVFTDDPRLSQEEAVERRRRARGGNGVVTPHRDEDGVWIVERDVILGQGVADYPAWNENGDN